MKNPYAKILGLAALLVSSGEWSNTAQAASGPAVITNQPASLTVLQGTPATFSVGVDGTPPFFYQWFRGGAPMTGVTNGSYTLSNTAAMDNGATFSVVVSNALGMASSSVATLTVDPGVLVTSNVELLNLGTQSWRYYTNGGDLGTLWRETGYSDASWPQGNALLGVETAGVYAEPIRTPFTAYTQPIITYYFRSHFNYQPTGNVQSVQLNVNSFLDDGAAFYLNGAEVGRVRLLAGQNAATLADSQPSEGSADNFSFTATNLVVGDNVIAVEVHQTTAASSDIIFGMGMTAAVTSRVADTIAPTISLITPTPGITVRDLTQIEVLFSEPVQGVDAGDLLINGIAATNVDFVGPGQFVFNFPQPATGMVTVAWAAGHLITDLAASPNAFVAGPAWNYTLDPNAASSDIRINEFLAVNSTSTGFRDEDGEGSDWVELYNSGSTAVNLNGWYLTDNVLNLTQWRFPNVTILPNSYLIVWASGKNRTNPIAPLHANFSLSSSGEYLGLILPDGVTRASEFAPSYPNPQTTLVSYGSDRFEPNLRGYFQTPTPGAPNSSRGAGFAPEVEFSQPSGTYSSTFPLTLSLNPPLTNAVIRYVLVSNNVATAALTNVPTASSPLYTGPLSIGHNVQVRARAFSSNTNEFPGPVRSETYVRLNANVLSFSSDLPLVVVHNFNGGTPPSTFDQTAFIAVYDAELTRSSLTNPPQMTARAGLNIRGSSTEGLAKKSFAVEFWDEFNQDQDYSPLNLPAESDWVLYAINYYDNGMLHNPIFYQLGQNLGTYSSRYRYVEVYTKFDATPLSTTDYNGVYVLLEKVKLNKNRVDIDRLAPEVTNAPAVTGGYIFKIDRADADENPTFNGAGQTIVNQNPSAPFLATPQGAPQKNYILSYFGGFNTALNSGGWTNLTGTNHYSYYINVPTWIEQHILNVLTYNVDAMRLSAYFYKPRNGSIEWGPPWDCDRCLGMSGLNGNDQRAFNPREWKHQAGGDQGTDFFGFQTQQWWGRLFQDPAFFQAWIDRWAELRQTIYSTTSINAMIDGLADQIRESQPRDLAKWPGFTVVRSGVTTFNGYTHTFPSPGTFQGEVNFMKRWFADRMDFIDTNFLRAPTLSIPAGAYPPGTQVTISPPAAPAGTVVYYTLDGTDPRLPSGALLVGALSNAGPVSITVNSAIRIFARSHNKTHSNLSAANPACSFGGCPQITSQWSAPVVGTYYLSNAIPPLRITEIMYHPSPLSGNTNEADQFEYIEFRNMGGSSLNVNRYRLRGGVDLDFGNVTLLPGAYCVAVKNLAAFQARYGNGATVVGVYTNDNLDNGGERLKLESALQEPILDFSYDDDWYPITDGQGFSLQIVNDSAARDTWGLKTSWRPSGSLGGTPGAADPGPAGIPVVYINEVLSKTDPLPGDGIELYNPNGAPVNVGGWFLTDEFDSPKKYRIPNGTMIAANGYLVFYQSNSFGVGPGGFALSSKGEAAYVFSGDANTNLTGHVHGFDFGAQSSGVTFGRYVISTGEDHFPAQTNPSLGGPNGAPKVGPIVIAEINYHPPDTQGLKELIDNTTDEYVELQNISGSTAPLFDPGFPTNTYRLRGGVDYDFPQGVSLPAGGFLLVVGFDPSNASAAAAFRARNGVPGFVPLYGPWSGKLDNSSDSVELRRADVPEVPPAVDAGSVYYVLADRVKYSDEAPWPGAADGFGPSLQRVVLSSYGNDPSNWVAAARTPGVARNTGAAPTITQQPMDATVLATLNASFSVTATGPGPLSYQWRHNGSPLLGSTNSILMLFSVQASQAGQYSCIVLSPSGSAISSNATLTVLIPASITQHPVDTDIRIRPDPLTDVAPNTNAVFSLIASSQNPPISYQWRFNGTNIAGATGPTYTVTNVVMTHLGQFSCAVSDGVGTIFSSNAWLYPLVRPLVWLAPVSQTVPAGSAVPVSVVLSNGWPPPIGYQWRSNSLNIATPTSNSRTNFFIIPSTFVSTGAIAATYRVVITNRAVPTFQVPNSAQFTITTVLDTDKDGIADSVEIALGLNPNNAADALLDLDGDGMINLAEVQAGTNPNDTNSFLRIDLGTMGTMANITVAAVSNRTYSVQYSDVLPASWSTLASLIARPTNRIELLKDPAWTTNRFYRLTLPAQ